MQHDDTRFTHLMTPGHLGSMDLRNRIVMCPMGLLFGNDDGTVSDNELAFYEMRARGGAGLLIVGTACVAYPIGTNHERMPAVSDDRYLPGMRRLAERVHAHGARLAAQLNFMGVYSFVDVEHGRARLVPYELATPKPDRISRMMTAEEAAAMVAPFMAPSAELGFKVAGEDDIAWVIERFADAADRCRRAGYDGVEVHGGHGYFIDEFLSPRNTRTDRWGGSVEGRARLLVEVVRAIRARVGNDYPVWMRINAVERHHRVGEQFEDQCRAIELAIAAGLDAVHLTAYANTDVATNATDSYAPHVVGPLADYAAAVRARVDVPVITFGRFEPDEAEQVLADGKADFVAMGRKLLADPDLPAKLAAGRVDDIRPCIYQYRCIGNIAFRKPARCVVNPRTGLEHDLRLERSAAPKQVLVVGGGPAGLETARVLARCGHRVTVREASTHLGGRLRDAAIADPLLDPYLGWLVREVERSGVEIVLGAPFAAEPVPAGFDEIVVATGAQWATPDVPVEGSRRVLALDDIRAWLRDDDATVGERVVVLGHGKAALSIADLCRRRARRVTVVGTEGYFAPELGPPGRYRLIAALEAAGVELLTNCTVEVVGEDGVHVRRGNEPRRVDADSVIGVAPRLPVATLAASLSSSGCRVHTVGDCDALGFVEGATTGALHIARALG